MNFLQMKPLVEFFKSAVLFFCTALLFSFALNRLVINKIIRINNTISEPIGRYLLLPVGDLTIGERYIITIPDKNMNIIKKLGYSADGTLIKTLAGFPGSTVRIEESALYINNKLVSTNRLINQVKGVDLLPMNTGNYKLGANEYFFIGQSSHSYDSRYFGFIKRSSIKNKAVFLGDF